MGPLIPQVWTSGDVCRAWVSKPGWIPLHAFLSVWSSDSPLVWHLLTIERSVWQQSFWSTYLYMCPQALVEVRGSNPRRLYRIKALIIGHLFPETRIRDKVPQNNALFFIQNYKSLFLNYDSINITYNYFRFRHSLPVWYTFKHANTSTSSFL